MSGQHLLVAISGHGLGHLSQASAVINALSFRVPALQLTIRSPITTSLLQQWIVPAFTHQCVEDDIGMRMSSALDVDLPASEAAYADLHEHWQSNVEALAERLRSMEVTLVVSDIAYLPLAAAQCARIPNVALCSLNWADVIARYFTSSQAQRWQAQAAEAYRQADAFLQPSPSMPMPWLENSYSVAPIGRVGECQRVLLLNRLELPAHVYIVLVGMGGMSLSLSTNRWPYELHGRPLHYLVPDTLLAQTPPLSGNLHAVSDAGLMYHHLMASVDLMLTKPGYGTFVEATACGLPVLYVPRDDWPDSHSLVAWLHKVGAAAEISREALAQGEFKTAMGQLLANGRSPLISPNGAPQAANYLLSLFDA